MGKPNRYLARKTLFEGVTYDSATEARRAFELGIRQRAGEITGLERQVAFELRVNGHLICTYKADFCYVEAATGESIVEDVKSAKTRTLHDYRIKVKLMHAIFGVNVREYLDGDLRRAVRLPKTKRQG